MYLGISINHVEHFKLTTSNETKTKTMLNAKHNTLSMKWAFIQRYLANNDSVEIN